MVRTDIPPGLKAVIFDWAGTMIDFGSLAPVSALRDLFAENGVPISAQEAQADMGRAKSDHITRLLAQPRIASAWKEVYGRDPDQEDAARLFRAIGPAMIQAAGQRAVLIPGAAQVAADLRAAGVKIGSCTGYTRDMMANILPRAAEQGYQPDCVVCAGDTPEGRPSPLMVWKNMADLGVWPASACVKVDDTPVGVAEGRNAGLWVVGIAASGNEVGLDADIFNALPVSDQTARIERARNRLLDAGAHIVIDTVADLPAALQKIPFGQSTDTLLDQA